jgi:hypothetical protein
VDEGDKKNTLKRSSNIMYNEEILSYEDNEKPFRNVTVK